LVVRVIHKIRRSGRGGNLLWNFGRTAQIAANLPGAKSGNGAKKAAAFGAGFI
jgi:hypothetical protein